MASSDDLEQRFNLAVKTIQNLPPKGILQPSNLTKLIFYGLYKQATLGPCKDPQPSIFNVIARAKWDAWNKYKTLNKEQAMLAYIDEIQKLIETMPQTNDVLEFSKSIRLSNKTNNDNDQENEKFASIHASNKLNSSESTSSLSSSSSSDTDQFYDNLSDEFPTSNNETNSNTNNESKQINDSTTNLRKTHNAHAIIPKNNKNNASTKSSTRKQEFLKLSNVTNQSDMNREFNKETQLAILRALTKLQQDINSISRRLDNLEASVQFLQQKQTNAPFNTNSPPSWLPLSGFPRITIAFILLWPFVIFILIRYFRVRTKIIIR